MANTYPITFESKNLLSKVKLGNDVYYVKDADLRAIVAQFGNAADQSVAASIGAAVPGLATGIQVYEYVNQKTADLTGAMHFVKGTRASNTNAKAVKGSLSMFMMVKPGNSLVMKVLGFPRLALSLDLIFKTILPLLN